ncbi:DMT family transporter [Thalassotalea agarivorans]|uniref:Permease of the drug/metabolite transporter (DMT) superfamily n=1 Tax=Thalassotalea agarivorans TaxID=349064 RepID=A0A1H9ZV88_THASX|nr:DMT family transporter [Thalassotalea agarivorans]SES85234.1 Permease of the drug/metabolite transporter (DMT) superfamily [Thalassotalea agarivorans]
MLVIVAYLVVLIVWSTTPLGIAWSAESVHPTMAVLSRMAIAWVLGLVIILCTPIKLPFSKPAKRLYLYSGIGIFCGMTLGYFASRHISSGLMSLVFGLAPIISGVLAPKVLKAKPLSRTQLVAMCIAAFGLTLVCIDGVSFGEKALLGIGYVLMAVTFFSVSGLLVKSVDIEIHPIATTVGALTYTMPLFFIAWLVSDGSFDVASWSQRSIAAILYLAIVGSLLGFVAYYYILQKLDATTVAFVTMLTPIAAVTLGAYLNHEPITFDLVFGGSLIMVGLALYNFGDKWIHRKRVAQ